MTYDFQQIAYDIPGSEGPIFDRLGRFFCVAPEKGELRQVDLATGAQRVHANTGGIPAGLQVDSDNFIWLADMKLGIFRISPEPDSPLEHIVSTFEGQPIRGCNDCSLDDRGGMYFTAPGGSSAEKPVGELYCLKADRTVVKLDEGFQFCNGLAVSADGSRLIVAETFTKKLWAYDIIEQGRLANRKAFATLPGEHRGGPDGIDFDAMGNLLSTNWGGSAIEVYDPAGELIERIMLPFANPSNLHFGSEDGRDLYITEHTHHGLWRTRWRYPGQAERWA